MFNKKYNNEDNFDISSDSSDSEDDKENYYSSSSSVSIPWAEDAIKNNQQIWERIERIFFDEEELPEDDKELRREILEWKKAFPQLRIKGNKISDSLKSESSIPINSEDEVDDIILLNPLRKTNFPSNNVNKYKRTLQETTKKPTFRKSTNENLPNLFEKDLRISSVPMVVNRRKHIEWDNLHKVKSQYEYAYINNNKLPNTFPQLHCSSHNRPNFEIISTQPAHYNKTIQQQNLRHINKSASFIRMPPIFSIITPTSATKTFVASHHKPTKIYLSNNTNSSKPEARSTTVYQQLPAININSNYNIERSISAALNHHRQINAATSYLPFSASKLKYSK